MRLLIIGGGAVSESNHIPAAISLLGIDNVFLAEPNKIQAEKIVSKYRIVHWSADYLNFLDQVDAVVIATPPHFHNIILSDCIKNDLPVLCEKPISPDPSESRNILAQNPKKTILAMCHTYRLFSNRIKVRQLIQEGYFGDNITIDIQEGFPSAWPTVSGYCFKKEMVPGGVLFDAGIHSLDFILWCMGDPSTIEYNDDEMGGLESNAEIKLTFQKGNASFKISRTCELSNKIIISGNSHTIELDIFEMNKWIENGVEKFADDEKISDWTSIGKIQLKDFIDAIENHTSVSCSLEDGIKVVEIIQKCYSKKQPTTVEPHPIGQYSGKKVLVTGGTGFIGSLLAERLCIHEQADVRVMVHNWPKAAYVSRFDVELIKADITDYDQVEKAVEDCDYVFHCVGVGGSAEYAHKINVAGTENIVKASSTHNIKRIIYLSSVVVHGDRITDNMNEDSPFVSYGDAYADSKMKAEEHFWSLSKEVGIEATAIRPTYVWGPLSEWYTIDIICQMRQNKFCFVNHGNGSCNAVYVENVIDLLLTCGIHPNAIGEAFLIRDEEQKEWKEFFANYARMLHILPESFQSIPLKDGLNRILLKTIKQILLKTISYLWEKVVATEDHYPLFAKWALRAPRKVMKLLLKQVIANLPEKSPSEMAIYNFQGFINIEKSEKLLGYKPRFSVNEAMVKTENWLRDQHYLAN